MSHSSALGNLVSAGMKKRVGAEPKPAPQRRIDGTIMLSGQSILFFAPSSIMDGPRRGQKKQKNHRYGNSLHSSSRPQEMIRWHLAAVI